MTKPDASSRRPTGVYLALALGVTTFSVSPILVRLASDAPALALATWRTLIAALILTPIALPRVLPELRRFTRKDILMVVGAGILLAGHFVLWIESLYHTSVASASVLVASSPIFLALLSYALLKEALSAGTALAIALGVVGAILIGVGDSGLIQDTSPRPTLGNALAICATLLFSVYFLIGRVMRQRTSWLGYVYSVYVVVAVAVFVFALARGTALLGHPPRVYLLCAAMALGPQLIGHGSMNLAVKYLTATLIGIISLLEPIGASIIAYKLFGEVPGSASFVGMVVTILAVALAMLAARYRVAENAVRANRKKRADAARNSQ